MTNLTVYPECSRPFGLKGYNLPDNISPSDPEAPWNQPDPIDWDDWPEPEDDDDLDDLDDLEAELDLDLDLDQDPDE